MVEPLVSVHMITYNQASSIGQAIEGVLQQKTNFPFELVIGEDYSTDDTRKIAFEYQRKFPQIVRVIASDQNLGLTKNTYRTELACRGKYIAYCEGDDYWHDPGKLQVQADYMEAHPECGLVHSDYDRRSIVSGDVIRNFNQAMNNKPPDNMDIVTILRGGSSLYILTCTVMVRRDILLKVINSDPALYQYDIYKTVDTLRWAEIAHLSGTHYIDKSLATYNVSPNSLSKPVDPIAQLQFSTSVSSGFIYLIDKYNLSELERQYHLNKWFQSAIPLAFYQRDKQFTRSIYNMKQRFTIKERIFIRGISSEIIYRSISIYKYIRNQGRLSSLKKYPKNI